MRIPQSGSSSKRGIKTRCLPMYALNKPRVGHPAKEGLRLQKPQFFRENEFSQSGSSSKRGIKTMDTKSGNSNIDPEWVIQQKRD